MLVFYLRLLNFLKFSNEEKISWTTDVIILFLVFFLEMGVMWI